MPSNRLALLKEVYRQLKCQGRITRESREIHISLLGPYTVNPPPKAAFSTLYLIICDLCWLDCIILWPITNNVITFYVGYSSKCCLIWGWTAPLLCLWPMRDGLCVVLCHKYEIWLATSTGICSSFVLLAAAIFEDTRCRQWKYGPKSPAPDDHLGSGHCSTIGQVVTMNPSYGMAEQC